MIRVSTKGRYALRAMIDLAMHSDDAPVARRDIADRQDISADYAAQLFRPLEDVGLVEGVKGPGGGYRLTRAPGEIRAREVVEALEGAVALAPCVDPEDPTGCPNADLCAARGLWERLSKAMTDLLDAYTLQDLCNEAEALS